MKNVGRFGGLDKVEYGNKIARMNGSKLYTDSWVLDKEEILGYAPTWAQEMMITIETAYGSKKSPAKIRNSLKTIGNGDLALATSGDLSPPTPNNPIQLMRDNHQIFLNLIALTTWWISISFNRYLISFNLKHLPGNIFINSGISPIADIIGHILWIFIQKLTNTKITFMGSFALSFIFGTWLIFISTSWLVPIWIVFAKIGLASGFSLWFYMMTEYFPPLFLSFAFGVTQFTSRSFTILSFPLSELSAPIPMILFSITPCLAFFLLWIFAKPPSIEDNDGKESLTIEINKDMRTTIKEYKRKLSSKVF